MTTAAPQGTCDRVPVAGTFRDVTGKPFNGDRDATRRLNALMRRDAFIRAKLPIRLINATQDSVGADFRTCGARYRGSADAEPAVVKYRGLFYATDGHHRIMDAADRGQTNVSIRLFDLDDNTQSDFPLLDDLCR